MRLRPANWTFENLVLRAYTSEAAHTTFIERVKSLAPSRRSGEQTFGGDGALHAKAGSESPSRALLLALGNQAQVAGSIRLLHPTEEECTKEICLGHLRWMKHTGQIEYLRGLITGKGLGLGRRG